MELSGIGNRYINITNFNYSNFDIITAKLLKF